MSILVQAKRELKQFDMIKDLCPHTTMEGYEFHALNPVIGCRNGGFGIECQNCCAITVVNKQTGRHGDVSKICRKVIAKTNGKHHWNGKLIENPYWLRHFKYNPSSKFLKYIVSYESDVSLWTPFQIASAYKLAYLAPKHQYYFLTKDPKTLLKKSEEAWDLLKLDEISLIKSRNIVICTSVGVNKALYRIEHLKKFSKYGFPLEVWFKPLLENIPNVDLSLINAIRVNAEKGKPNRDWEPSWIVSILKAARKYNTTVSFDMHHKVLQKKRTDCMNKITALTERMRSNASTAR